MSHFHQGQLNVINKAAAWLSTQTAVHSIRWTTPSTLSKILLPASPLSVTKLPYLCWQLSAFQVLLHSTHTSTPHVLLTLRSTCACSSGSLHCFPCVSCSACSSLCRPCIASATPAGCCHTGASCRWTHTYTNKHTCSH